MPHNFAGFTTILILLVAHLQVLSQAAMEWVSVKKEKGLEIFTRDNEQSGVKEIRITIIAKSTVNKIVEVLGDVPNYTTWVYKCTESIRLQTVSENEFYYYVVCDFPFPFSDRDLVVHSTQHIDAYGTYHSLSRANFDMMAEMEEFIRIPTFESYWRVHPISTSQVQIDYQARSEPGGAIPIWLVNLAITVGPYETVKKFIEQIEQGSL